jgi:hypothetical protein
MTGVRKGITFAIIIWFLRVVMGALSRWMMFDIPEAADVHARSGFF